MMMMCTYNIITDAVKPRVMFLDRQHVLLTNVSDATVHCSGKAPKKCSDVVLETKVLVSRRLEDKNTSLGLGLGLEIKVLVLILVLTKKS